MAVRYQCLVGPVAPRPTGFRHSDALPVALRQPACLVHSIRWAHGPSVNAGQVPDCLAHRAMLVGAVGRVHKPDVPETRPQDYEALPGLRDTVVGALDDTPPHLVAIEAGEEVPKHTAALKRHEAGHVLHRHYVRLCFLDDLSELFEQTPLGVRTPILRLARVRRKRLAWCTTHENPRSVWGEQGVDPLARQSSDVLLVELRPVVRLVCVLARRVDIYASLYIEALENEAVAQAADAAEEIDDTPPFRAGARSNGRSFWRWSRGIRLHGLFHSRHLDERRHQRPHEADSSPTGWVDGTSVRASVRAGQVMGRSIDSLTPLLGSVGLLVFQALKRCGLRNAGETYSICMHLPTPQERPRRGTGPRVGLIGHRPAIC